MSLTWIYGEWDSAIPTKLWFLSQLILIHNSSAHFCGSFIYIMGWKIIFFWLILFSQKGEVSFPFQIGSLCTHSLSKQLELNLPHAWLAGIAKTFPLGIRDYSYLAGREGCWLLSQVPPANENNEIVRFTQPSLVNRDRDWSSKVKFIKRSCSIRETLFAPKYHGFHPFLVIRY